MKDVAVAAAREAGKVLMDNLGQIASSSVSHKQQFDFVTDVDRKAEETAIAVIRDSFPSHKILAEESLRDRSGGYRWIIDPLDGTTNYIHGYPVFSVSIALEHDGEIVIGVVFDPTRDELFVAEKGQGAFLNEKPIRVSKIEDPALALFTTGFPFRSKDYIDVYLASFKELFYKISGARRCGSAALDFAYLAAGRCDGFWEIGLSPWDIAAGFLLIKEAGGEVTDFAGTGDMLETGNVVATNGLLHKMALESVQKIFSGIIDK